MACVNGSDSDATRGDMASQGKNGRPGRILHGAGADRQKTLQDGIGLSVAGVAESAELVKTRVSSEGAVRSYRFRSFHVE